MAANKKPCGWMITNNDGWACHPDLDAMVRLAHFLEERDGIKRRVMMGERPDGGPEICWGTRAKRRSAK
jgi:hypothetical protein